MYWHRRWLLAIILATSSAISFAQEADSLILSAVDDFTFEDSLSVFNLIDSLLEHAGDNGSQLAVRLSYNSNVLSAGRTLGIQNFGLAPGLSYYHKSGFYADVSGYWSKDFDPSYYLTVASLGYMVSFSKQFSLMAEYDRYFYTSQSDNEFIPYKNTLSVTPIVELKPVLLSVNYAYYFGDDQVHRIMPGIGITLQKKKLFKIIDRIAITPSFYMLMGNETLTAIEFVAPKTIIDALKNKRDYGTYFRLEQKNTNVFGIMNYAITVPLSVTYKSWGFSFTYTYNIPKALPGEPLTISESSYLSGSLTYFISFKRNKFAL